MNTQNYETIDSEVYIDGTAYWASVHTPNHMSGKYELTLVPDDQEAVREMGVSLKTKDTEGAIPSEPYVVIASSANAKWPIKVVFDDTEVPEGTLVGNGSKVRVKCELAKTYFGKKSFFKLARPKVVRVKELVRYGGNEDDKLYA
jgi:hypothetical protein